MLPVSEDEQQPASAAIHALAAVPPHASKQPFSVKELHDKGRCNMTTPATMPQCTIITIGMAAENAHSSCGPAHLVPLCGCAAHAASDHTGTPQHSTMGAMHPKVLNPSSDCSAIMELGASTLAASAAHASVTVVTASRCSCARPVPLTCQQQPNHYILQCLLDASTAIDECVCMGPLHKQAAV